MARKKSPHLVVPLADADYEIARKSKSGGCLVADAIKRTYPQYTSVSVDMATVRFTDREAGERYVYLSPPSVQHALLAFDQGWPKPVDQVTLKRPVKVTRVVRSSEAARRKEERQEILEAKEARGEKLTRNERAALTRMRAAPERPTNYGPSEATTEERQVVIHGGKPPVKAAHPNLLSGYDRHFGARLADPGDVFNQAVEAAVAERLASMEDLSWQ